jgi:hypothetical protein
MNQQFFGKLCAAGISIALLLPENWHSSRNAIAAAKNHYADPSI